MRFIFLIVVILVFMENYAVESSEVDVKDEQSWYEDVEKSDNGQVKKDSVTIDNDDPTYQKLLSVERQIVMSQEMIKLYKERLGVLQELRKQLKRKITLQNMRIERKQYDQGSQPEIPSQENVDQRNQNNNDKKEDSSKDKFRSNRQNRQSQTYISLNKYEIATNQGMGSSSHHKIEDSVILIPPFLINKVKSQVSLISQKQNLNLENRYEFGSTSKRLLFYSLQNNLEQNKKHHEQDSPQANRYVLNLALEIKPNKIKSVKITYHQRGGNLSSHINKFEVQEVVTSYESNELISQNFKWHKALDFENLIIGFVNQTVCIKGKDKKMSQIDVGSKVLNVYSLNQYKVLFIAEDRVGTINVRSFLKADEVRFQHYLGNITLIKQKELQRQKAQTSSEVQEDYAHESFDAGMYWDSPFIKKFETIRAVSVYHLEMAKQFLILLSNGEVLLYSNQKIFASNNLGTQLMKEFRFQNLRLTNQNDILSNAQIKMEVLAPFRHLLISSNLHSKILVFNVTIPYLTLAAKGSGMSLFSSSLRQKQLTSKYWRALELPTQISKTSNPENQIYLYVKSIASFHIQQDTVKIPSDIYDKVVHLYHCSQSQKGITISEYRLLLNLFDHNGFTGTISPTSQGRSWWWNVLMVAMIVTGVVVFRKCKQSTAQPKYDWEDPAIQRLYKPKNPKSTLGKQNPKAMTKEPESTQRKPTTTKSKIQYDNMVISELQTYLQKQGQKLTKQQIACMVRQMQQNQQKELRAKTQMKRQETKVENDPNENNLEPKTKNPKANEDKKKPSPQEKAKTDQNAKKKKQ